MSIRDMRPGCDFVHAGRVLESDSVAYMRVLYVHINPVYELVEPTNVGELAVLED